MSSYALLLLASAVIYIVYYRYLHPLASIPSPGISACLSRLWLIRHSRKGDMNCRMIELHAKHGSLVRTGPNEVSTSDPTAIKTIYSAGSKFRKSDWYSVWQGHRKFDLFGERNESVHSQQRRLVSSAYSMSSLLDLESSVDDAIQVFLEKMATMEIVDMKKWSQLYAFDVIGGVTFSRLFGFMSAGQDDGSFGQITNALESGAWVGQIPSIYWLNDLLVPYIGNWLNVNARHGSLRTFATREIAARKDRDGSHNDILSKLFAVSKMKPALDEGAVASMATSNVFAGSDTTAISIRAIIYYLLRNPQCKTRLLEEIDSVGAKVTYAQAEKMPYLQAVMHEALRLYPAVGFGLMRVVPECGIVINDKHIPAGTSIGVNPWVIHRDKSIFGDDIEAFRPERWLNATGDMHRFFFTFGSGSRVCIGRNISWMEMSKVIPALFSQFELEMCEPGKEWTTTCWWFVMQDEFKVRIRRRGPA